MSLDRVVDASRLPHPRPCWCDDCRKTYGREYRALRRREVERSCGRCGTVFMASTDRQFCSPACASWRPPAPDRVCRHPECAVVVRGPGQKKFCSDICRASYHHAVRVAEQRRRAQLVEERECRWCFVRFTVRGMSLREFCSPVHAKAALQHVKTWHAPDRCHLPVCIDCCQQGGFRPQAVRCPDCQAVVDTRRRGVQVGRRQDRERRGDRIDLLELGDRDGWRCHLCARRVDPTLKHPHPKSGTRDHLIPIAAGGEHTWANVKLAHRDCNVRRHTGGTAQLMLVG